MGQKYAVFNEKGLPLAFYDSDIHNNIPENAIKITDEEWRTFINNQGKFAYINGKLIDITNKVWDDVNKVWRDKSNDEILQEKKENALKAINAKTQQYLDNAFRELDWGNNEADALASIQNTIDVSLGQILYLLEEDLKSQGKDTSKITVSTFWKRAALYLAGEYTSDDAMQEMQSLGVSDQTIQEVLPLLQEIIEAAALKLWDEEVWRYEEKLEEAIQNATSIEEIGQILQSIQFPPPPGGEN
jgi:hypothetical protein